MKLERLREGTVGFKYSYTYYICKDYLTQNAKKSYPVPYEYMGAFNRTETHDMQHTFFAFSTFRYNNAYQFQDTEKEETEYTFSKTAIFEDFRIETIQEGDVIIPVPVLQAWKHLNPKAEIYYFQHARYGGVRIDRTKLTEKALKNFNILFGNDNISYNTTAL